MIKTLQAEHHLLSATEEQVKLLENSIFASGELPTFKETIGKWGQSELRPDKVDIFQVNLGYMCNQTCKHCHVDAGPDRKEIMSRETMQICLKILKENKYHTLDLTGGAPEMNPDFRWFVTEAKLAGVQEIIVRSNLTIILANPKFRDLPQFFKDHGIRLVSSLPFYLPEKTDRQRGAGVFKKSIEALQILNAAGYGRENGLIIDLVYNPGGAFLPADQEGLERDFKKELKNQYDVDFNNLLAITNLPISRFLDFLVRTDNFEDYMDTLVRAFNPATLTGIMCKNTLSIGWDGYIYDCDFNQMLGLKVNHPVSHIRDFDGETINRREIVVNQHCYGCTAGAGSSCQGTVA
ncbi:MAG: arsenosugar biosynthesis radical SAM protein ArsS [Cyclobacteriaceae bacterium]|nr:arsenosugar biosynthesis radical SAM protein ArsS [Cyclobacteriaceae bacterium]